MAEWWEEAFRADYLRVYPHRDDAEAMFDVKNLRLGPPGLDPGHRVLDLACGAGRHLRAMKALGVGAVGADLSADLLTEARRRGAEKLVRCDLRRLPFRERGFDRVTMFFNSFGYFPTEEEDASVLREAARILVPEGGLFLDLMNPPEARRLLVPRSETMREGVEILEERDLVDDGRRVRKRVKLRKEGVVREWTESVRLYSESEICLMAGDVGLTLRGSIVERGQSLNHGGVPRMVLTFVKAAA